MEPDNAAEPLVEMTPGPIATEIARDFLSLDFVVGHFVYWVFIVVMLTGLYIVVAKGNLLKKIVGLNIFQAAVFMLYISMGKVAGGSAPIEPVYGGPRVDAVYSAPLPHVLILTAIVVGIATTSLGLALIIRIRETYGTIEEDEILQIDHTAEKILDDAEGEMTLPPRPASEAGAASEPSA